MKVNSICLKICARVGFRSAGGRPASAAPESAARARRYSRSCKEGPVYTADEVYYEA